ncbi:MAG: carbohydrate binding family 9 domain-containing protein [Candidatus Aminicenantes bacterium]|nr:carbohydrate binding family 9 domain-containing protein [Candidatus Aminicenantes bacterium]
MSYRNFFSQSLLFVCIIFLAGRVWAEDPSKNSAQNNKILRDANGKRYITVIRTETPLKIDGLLNDPAWRTAQFQGQFTQREPEEGAPASEKTEVGFLYDKKNLYIGVKCYDSEADKIIAREMRRDAIVDDDDYFELVLDTYHDHRTAYYFITNPHGVKREAVLANEGRDYNPAWDGVWLCKAKITDDGWFVEIAIPWKTLRFEEQGSSVWGINFARMIRRNNEHVYWQLIPRDFGRGAGLFRLSEAGSLHGIADAKMGGNLELRPYFLGGMENDQNTNFTTDRLGDIGLDAKVALTANLALDLTLNTDFAQVEADQEQVNLTRFSLYYPEKREFFLEGAELFSFGGTGRGSWHRGGSDMDLYYSRRLGLVDGHEARILGGAKMVGKIGKYQVGIMNILTDDVTIQEEDETTKVNSTNFTVVRFRRDILQRGTIGIMFLNKEELHSSYFNRSLGFDGHLPLSLYFTISGYLAATFGPEETDDGQIINMNKQNLAGKLNLGYNSDLWQASASYQGVGAHFNPEIGFIRRTDFRLSSASIEYSPRPKESSVIRQFSYQLEGSYRSDHDNRMLDSAIEASFSIELQNSSRFSINIQRESEFIDYDWEVREGFLIPKGTHTGYMYSIGAESDKGRTIAGGIDIDYGSYYAGHQMRFSLNSTITCIRRLRMEMDYNHNYVDLPEGSFHTNTFGLRMIYFFSTELYLKAYVQWNDDKYYNAGKEKIVGDILLRWIYSPACNLYLVYNDGRLIGPENNEIINRTLMVKVTYFWRK